MRTGWGSRSIAMVDGAAPLVAPLARRRTQLREKGKVRAHKHITRRLPAGASALASVPKGMDFASSSGAMSSFDVDAWLGEQFVVGSKTILLNSRKEGRDNRLRTPNSNTIAVAPGVPHRDLGLGGSASRNDRIS